MTILLTIIHVIVSLFLIGVVLLQTGKRADLAGAFGGGGSQTAFGTRGAATVLAKATTIGAVLFMFTSIGLSVDAARRSGSGTSVLPEDEPPPISEAAPSDSSQLPASGELPELPVSDDPLAESESDPSDTEESAEPVEPPSDGEQP
jgi:preprotein translocase subunit SecG